MVNAEEYVRHLGGLPTSCERAVWALFGDNFFRGASRVNGATAVARNRRAVKVRYLRRIVVGQPLPDVTPDLVWVTVAEKKRLVPSYTVPNKAYTETSLVEN